MRVARPPGAGRSQILPCRSMASVCPSGATATAIEVPSWTSTSMGAASDGGPARAAPLSAAITLKNASRSVRQLMSVLQARDDDAACSHADNNLADFFLPPAAGAWCLHYGAAHGGIPHPVLRGVPVSSVRHRG